MKPATVLILLLAHHGLWFGGEENAVTVRPAVAGALPESVVEWRLSYAGVRVADGTAPMAADGSGARIEVKLPDVRVHTSMRWTCQVRRRDDGRELASAEATIGVFPKVPLSDLAKPYADKKLLVIDRPEGIPALLTEAGITHAAADVNVALVAARQDAILVGADQLENSAATRAALVGQAEQGASVLVLRQPGDATVQFPLTARRAPRTYALDARHALLDGLSEDEWQAAMRGDGAGGEAGDTVRAIQLPADAPALDVVAFPREVEGGGPVPVDALLVVQSVGKGRLVLCQMPLTDFAHDPAARILLRNALDYLLTRPQPTPPPSQRAEGKKATDEDRGGGRTPTISLEGTKKP